MQKPFKKDQFKALIVDVDGTLVRNDKDAMPSIRTTRAIAQASTLLHVGVATGRPLSMTAHIFDHLQLSGPSIVSGGSRVVDVKNKQVLFEQAMEETSITQIATIGKQFALDIFITDGNNEHKLTDSLHLTSPLELYFPGVNPDQVDTVVSHLSHIPNISIHKAASWKHGCLDILITHAAATKQHGIQKVAEVLGISTHEIIGIGDGYNDFPLLMACGYKIAMGNAFDDLKAIADYVAPSVEQDGVAHVIETFLLSER